MKVWMCALIQKNIWSRAVCVEEVMASVTALPDSGGGQQQWRQFPTQQGLSTGQDAHHSPEISPVQITPGNKRKEKSARQKNNSARDGQRHWGRRTGTSCLMQADQVLCSPKRQDLGNQRRTTIVKDGYKPTDLLDRGKRKSSGCCGQEKLKALFCLY